MQEYTGTLLLRLHAVVLLLGVTAGAHLAWVLLVAPQRQASFPLHQELFLPLYQFSIVFAPLSHLPSE